MMDPERLRLFKATLKGNLVAAARSAPPPPTTGIAALEGHNNTSLYRLPTGTQALRPLQERFLNELRRIVQPVPGGPRGVIAQIGVGGGKTLCAVLAAFACEAKRPVLVLPAEMREAFTQEYERIGKNWKRPQNFRMLSYSEVSVASGEEKLKFLNPDLLIFDECHNIASHDSARTRKFLRYLEESPSVRVAMLSGTMTRRSLMDYAHLFRVTLVSANPLPTNTYDLTSWAKVLDARTDPQDGDFAAVRRFYAGYDKQEAQVAFGQWLSEQPLIINMPNSVTCESTILATQQEVQVPANVQWAIQEFEKTWTRPDGEEIASALDAFRLRQQLAQGFYYRWEWPNGKVDHEWLDARKCWHGNLRRILNRHSPGLDSPLLVARALQLGNIKDTLALAALEKWHTVRVRPPPPTVPVWLSSFLVERAVQWAKKTRTKGIIWYLDNAVGVQLKAAGLPVYGAGQFPLLNGEVVACSIRAHGTGKNLQDYNKNLILSFPPSGARIEQLVGRTHRPGQQADEVLVDFFGHTTSARDAIRGAVVDAEYISASSQNKQKLELATWNMHFDRFSPMEKKEMFADNADRLEDEEDFEEPLDAL